MKVGLRTPSPTKRVKAKTTGKMKRAAKKAVNPVYGKKGMGYIKDPERAVKNAIYHQVTVDPLKEIQKHSDEIPDFEPSEKPAAAPPKSMWTCFIFFGICLYCISSGFSMVKLLIAIVAFIVGLIIFFRGIK